MTKWITVAMLALLLAPLAFAQTLSDAEYQKLKEQIKREVIEELKAEYNLVPKTSATSAEPVEAEPEKANTQREIKPMTPKVVTPTTISPQPRPTEEKKTDDVRDIPVESRFDIVSKHINTLTGEIVYKTNDGKFLDKEGNIISSEQVEILESTVEEPSRKLVNPSRSTAAQPPSGEEE
jgi:hypothetical protein